MPQKDIKVLVVEDDTSIREALVARFKKEDFQVKGAADGEEGYNEALNWQPDLIMLDILMPKMNGIQTLEAIRTSGDYGKDVPVVLLTNVAPDDKVLKELVQLKPNGYLSKTDVIGSEGVSIIIKSFSFSSFSIPEDSKLNSPDFLGL